MMPRMSRLGQTISCVALALASSASGMLLAQGQSPRDPRAALPERPTVATHAHTVAPGFIELEAGIQGLHAGAAGTEYDTPSLIKVGLASHLQLDVYEGVTAIRQTGQNALGIGDISAGVKWRIFDGLPIVGDFALQSTVSLPTGSADKGTGTGTTGVNVLVISSNQLGPVSLDVNVGFSRRSGDQSVVPNQATLWTAAFSLPVRGRAGWAVEFFGFPGTTGPTGTRPIVGLTTGPMFALRRYLVLDCGAVFGLAGSQSTVLYGGVTWNIGRLPW